MDIEQTYMRRLAQQQYPGDVDAMAQGEQQGLEQAAMQATVGTLPEDTKNITAAQFGKMAMDVPAAMLKGGVQATIGLPGDLISLGRGIAAAISPQPGEGRLDAFLRGTEGKTLLPTTEDVRAFLDRTIGPVVPASETDEARRKAAEIPEFIGELGGAGKTVAAGARGVAAVAKDLAPTAGRMAEDLLRRQGLLLPAVPLERYGQVAADAAARVDAGDVRLSNDVSQGMELQLAPQYRVKVDGAYTVEGKGQNITNAVNPGNVASVSARLDDLQTAFPDPLKSPEDFSAMMATVYNSNDVPMPPRWMIENANDMNKWSDWFGSMSKGQIDEASRGFAVVDDFKQVYQSGAAKADTTGTLMFWAMMSRMASAYPHESGFLDLAESMLPYIRKAVAGQYTQADADAALTMIRETVPAGSPGRMVISNANDFVSIFLLKMGQTLPDGRSKLQALHDMIANPEMTGPEIRRAFYGLAEGVGIKNKVLSFALLVSGRDDVMVLDRIQINRLFAGGEKIYDDVNTIFDGGPGLAIYEGLERSLAPRVKELYARVGRPQDASLGRYHWESWVLSSGQEVAHPTLGTIVKKARGEPEAFAGVPVKEGRMHQTAFGVEYEKLPGGGNRLVYQTDDGSRYAMTAEELKEVFNHVMDQKNGIIPDNFPGVKFFSVDTVPADFNVAQAPPGIDLRPGQPNPFFGRPWYDWPGVNKELIDDYAAAVGSRIQPSRSAGAVPQTQQGGAANGPIRAATRGGQ
jgi:hypothetical protein